MSMFGEDGRMAGDAALPYQGAPKALNAGAPARPRPGPLGGLYFQRGVPCRLGPPKWGRSDGIHLGHVLCASIFPLATSSPTSPFTVHHHPSSRLQSSETGLIPSPIPRASTRATRCGVGQAACR